MLLRKKYKYLTRIFSEAHIYHIIASSMNVFYKLLLLLKIIRNKIIISNKLI